MKQRKFLFSKGHVPKFEIGQEIFVVMSPETYLKTTIRCINCDLGPSKEGGYVLYKPKYDVRHILFPNKYFDSDAEQTAGLPEYRIFNDEEEAEAMAVLVKVKMTRKQWLQAVGDRDSEDSLEDCELQPCCSKISDIRDIFLKCKKYGGLTKLEVLDMEWIKDVLLEHNKNEENSPLLFEILSQLGVY